MPCSRRCGGAGSPENTAAPAGGVEPSTDPVTLQGDHVWGGPSPPTHPPPWYLVSGYRKSCKITALKLLKFQRLFQLPQLTLSAAKLPASALGGDVFTPKLEDLWKITWQTQGVMDIFTLLQDRLVVLPGQPHTKVSGR